jgi:urease accessory protein
MTRRVAGLAPLVVGLLSPTVAHAHLVNSGLGPFYDGALHLLLSPMNLVLLAALCLLVGAQGARAARSAMVVALVAWFVAGAFAISTDIVGPFAIVDAAGLLLLGVAIALDIRMPALATAALATGVAAWLGFQSGQELISADQHWRALVGATSIAMMFMLLALSLVVSTTSFPARVVCRILGSWAAATGLLSIGWLFSAGR